MCQKPLERFLLDWRRWDQRATSPLCTGRGRYSARTADSETGERVVFNLSLVRFLRNLILSPILPVFLSWGLGFPMCTLYHLLRTPPVYAF